MKSSNNVASIFVIGGRQAGKTTLAAGLFSVSRPGFVVDARDRETRMYLTQRKVELQSGKWPDSTTLGTHRNLCLSLKSKNRKAVGVDFFDYAGEKVENPEEIKSILAKAGGATGFAILANPGMEAFLDPDKRTNLFEIYKIIANDLKSRGCLSCAVVVTASDRLETDLKDKKDEFNQFVSEITNYLDVSGFESKRFDVTITGRLKEQNKPKLAAGAENTTSLPFEWLVQNITREPPRWPRVVRGLGTACAVFLAGFGIYQWKSSDVESSKVDETVGGIEKEIKSLEDDTGWDSRRRQINKVKGKLTNFNPDSYHSSKARNNAEEKYTELTNRFNTVRLVWESAFEGHIQTVIGKLSDGSEESCKKIDNVFEQFDPSSGTGKQIRNTASEAWQTQRSEKRKKYDLENFVNPVERRLKECTGIHGYAVLTNLLAVQKVESNVTSILDRVNSVNERRDKRILDEFETYIDEFSKMAPTNATQKNVVWLKENLSALKLFVPTNPETCESFSNLVSNVGSNAPSWRLSYETKQVNDEVAGICDNLGRDTISKGDLKRAFRYHPDKWTADQIPLGVVDTNQFQIVWNRAWERLSGARNGFRTNFISEILNKTNNGQPLQDEEAKKMFNSYWDSETATQNELNFWLTSLSTQLHAQQESWKSEQRGKIQRFKKIEYTGEKFTAKMLQDFIKAYNGVFKCNPYREDLRTDTLDRLEKQLTNDVVFLERRWQSSQELQQTFNEFRTLLAVLATDGDQIFADTWCLSFAKSCRDNARGKIETGVYNCFPRTFTITKIEGLFCYEDKRWQHFPLNFKGTKFRVEVSGSSGASSKIVDQLIGKKQDGKWSTLNLLEEHFQWISFGQFNSPKFNVSLFEQFGRVGGSAEKEGTKKDFLTIDLLSFDSQPRQVEETKKSDIKHTDGSNNPTFGIRVYGYWTGKTLRDYLRESKGEPVQNESPVIFHSKKGASSGR